MIQPTLQHLVQLVTIGETSMFGNETIHTQEDTVFPYYYNHEGLTLYNFQSLQHLVLFFYGTDAQKEQAKTMCKIETYNPDISAINQEETWDTVQEGYPRHVHIQEADMGECVWIKSLSKYLNLKTADLFTVTNIEGIQIVDQDSIQNINDIEDEDIFFFMSDGEFEKFQKAAPHIAEYKKETIVSLLSWNYTLESIICPSHVKEAMQTNDVYYITLDDGGSSLLRSELNIEEYITNKMIAFFTE